jgi:TolC family type I secretion outer membrane protein
MRTFAALAMFWGMLPLASSAQESSSQNGDVFTLDRCIKLALENNSALRNAERNYQITGTGVTSSRSALLPRVNVNLSSGRFRQGDRTLQQDVPVGVDSSTGAVFYERREITQSGFTSSSNAAQVSVSQTLFDFGATINQLRQASASEDASRFSFESAKQNTILLVKQRYFGYLRNQRLLEVNQEAVKSAEEQLKRTESMYEIGSVAQGDVFRARTQYGNERISLINQQNAVQNSRALLNVALGRSADAPLSVADVEEVPESKTYEMQEVLRVAEEKNPELQSIEKEKRSAQLGIHVARTAYLPSFSIQGNYSRSNNEFNKVYSDFDKNWSGSIGIGMSLNLFNGFADQANLERQQLTYRIAEENAIDRRRNLRLEVEQALLSLRAWKEITAINSDNLISAQEDLRLAQERYRVGAGTLLDIINAQVNVTRAKTTLVQAKYDSMISQASLEAAMGVLQP